MVANEEDEIIKETVEVREPMIPPGARWQPVIGSETIELLHSLNNLSQSEKDRLAQESVNILSRCVPPSAPDTRDAGLIVGNIQSGKTMSFTAVSALARDNSYRVIIVITGTVKILNSQSVKRLVNQLRLSSRSDFAWKLYRNPGSSANGGNNPRNRTLAEEIDGILRDWGTQTPRGLQPQTILITLLKNATRLRAASSLLERLNLHNVPVLIIDDEADQAGLNTAVNQGSQSATYRDLLRLRNALPHHTYLGYTATPQAPLLINVMDMLSARFAQVLTPGDDYAGGTAFFDFQPSLVRIIPNNQIPSDDNPITVPPLSFREAMRLYFVGVAVGILGREQRQGPQNRSMLVHPSMFTAQHAQFFLWVQQLKTSWSNLLNSTDRSDKEDKEQLVSEFKNAYDDLASTQSEIPDFDSVLEVLPQAINRTVVYEINRRPSNPFPDIEDIDEFWRSSYSFILVGGQSLERGFTVSGLTVTYMPRGIGVGHADTVQQRARFYGYNRQYLGFCRVYLENDAFQAYGTYIGHEDQLRNSLATHSNVGMPLNEWKRAFFLDRSLKPTRDSVIDIDYRRGPEADRLYDAMPPIFSQEDLSENRDLVRTFIAGFTFIPDTGDPRRTDAQRHELNSNVPLRDALEKLIVPLRINDPSDSVNFMLIRIQIERYLETHPDALCSVYRMKPRFSDMRTLTVDGRINPFQGANPRTGYPGDNAILDPGVVTIQIYNFGSISARNSSTIATDVPIITIALPRDVATGMVAQSQGDWSQ
ncbi:MAG: hypothetical protein JRN15_13770 [Nitrososphaerota archaeon]|nr:hypothetical protein [Nitrososphaerota archaeon]